jgi:hypothetical protein
VNRKLKGIIIYVRHCFSGSARSPVARRAPYVAAQPKLGILPQRRNGRGFGNFGRPAFAGQDLNKMRANLDADQHGNKSAKLLKGGYE